MNIHWVDGDLVRRTKAQHIEVDQPLSKEFHTFGFLWTERELVWYFKGREIRRESNFFAHADASVFLSSAVIKWAGPVTDAIDGTSMDVDYVRVWRQP